jgi:hypothetical protein
MRGNEGQIDLTSSCERKALLSNSVFTQQELARAVG